MHYGRVIWVCAWILGTLNSVNNADAFNPTEWCDDRSNLISNLKVHGETRQIMLKDGLGRLLEVFYHTGDERRSYTILRTGIVDQATHKKETCMVSAGDVVPDLVNKTGDERFVALLDENNGTLYEIFREVTGKVYTMYSSNKYNKFKPELIYIDEVVWVNPNAIIQSEASSF